MENIGIDVHKRESQLCIIEENGEVIERRIRTDRARFAEVLGTRTRARILIEASTESEWVARCLEEIGHEVIVADPSYAPMYATRSRRVKTDRRDARTLADALMTGAYRPAHRTSDRQRHIRTRLGVRQQLVQTRVKFVCAIESIVRRQGWRIDRGSTKHFLTRLGRLPLTKEVKLEINPLIQLLRAVNEQIETLDGELTSLADKDALTNRLRTAPGVGAITALTFVAVVDDVTRFPKAHNLEAYLGLVPSEHSSGERQRRGRITKTGDRQMRRLLVQATLSLLRTRRSDSRWLQDWANAIAVRRGKQIARVALARKLAGILYAMMRDGTPFRAPSSQAPPAERQSA